MSDRPLDIYRLGLVEYADGLALMAAFHAARLAGAVPDTLFLLEHPAVLTLGRKAKRSDVLIDGQALAARGWPVIETDRGGEVTYHGPGQLVGYPILDLSPDRRDVRRYVRDLEETMLRAAADFGVHAGRVAGLNGIWLAPDAFPAAPGPARKLGAVGVHLARWVTSHGFALNANVDLAAYQAIVACGIADRGVTSLAGELGRPVDFQGLAASVADHFGEIFERRPAERQRQRLTVQVQVVRPGASGPELLALRRVAWRGGFWQPVTGRLEAGETPLVAAAREVGEETGLAGSVVALDYRHAFLYPTPASARPVIGEEIAYLAAAPADFEPRLSAEHDAFAWLPLSQARARFPFAGLQRGAALAAAASGFAGAGTAAHG